MRSGKFEKGIGVPAHAEARRLPAPAPSSGRAGKGRRKNFEQADEALRERIARDEEDARRRGFPHDSYYRQHLPEVAGNLKAKRRDARKEKCVCEHRRDKHLRRTYHGRIEPAPCRACRDCEAFTPTPSPSPATDTPEGDKDL